MRKAGLGHPPTHFTTNANESINNVIKQALHYEEKNWDKFCDEMLNLVKIQYQELEKAVYVLVNIIFKLGSLTWKSLYLCGPGCLLSREKGT